MIPSRLTKHTAQCPLSCPSSATHSSASHLHSRGSCVAKPSHLHRRPLRVKAAEAVAEPPASPADSAAPVPQVSSQNVPRRDQRFVASFLWLEGTIGVCVDQVFSQGQRSPVTEYFLWPKRDAWDELRAALDARSWISEADKNDLLNETTAVFEYWQEDPKHSLDEARSAFQSSIFIGS